MADRMDTLGGKMSNLGDSWDKLFRTISESGIGEQFATSVQVGIDMIEELNAMIASGQFENNLRSWTVAFEEWASDFELTIGYIVDLFDSETEEMSKSEQSFFDDFSRNIKMLPALFRAGVQRIAVELNTLVQYGIAAGQGIHDAIVAGLKATLRSTVIYAKAIGKALINPIDTFRTGGAGIKAAGCKFCRSIRKRQGNH